MEGLVVTCSPNEFVVFNPPPGLTCQQWAGPFLPNAPGYLNNPSATSGCQYCPVATGDAYLAMQLTWSPANKWRNFGILAAFTILNVITTGLFIYRWVCSLRTWSCESVGLGPDLVLFFDSAGGGRETRGRLLFLETFINACNLLYRRNFVKSCNTKNSPRTYPAKGTLGYQDLLLPIPVRFFCLLESTAIKLFSIKQKKTKTKNPS